MSHFFSTADNPDPFRLLPESALGSALTEFSEEKLNRLGLKRLQGFLLSEATSFSKSIVAHALGPLDIYIHSSVEARRGAAEMLENAVLSEKPDLDSANPELENVKEKRSVAA